MSRQYISSSFIVDMTFNDFQTLLFLKLDWVYFLDGLNLQIWPQEPAGRTLSALKLYRSSWRKLYQHGWMACTQYSSNLFLHPVQLELVSAVLNSHNILCCTATGDGKSAAFTIPGLVLKYNAHLDAYPAGLPTWKRPIGVVITPTKGLSNNIICFLPFSYVARLPLFRFLNCQNWTSPLSRTAVTQSISATKSGGKSQEHSVYHSIRHSNLSLMDWMARSSLIYFHT